jgi:hypothetical protein
LTYWFNEKIIMSALKEMMEGADGSKEHDEMFPCSPDNVIENLEHQDQETTRPSVSFELVSQVETHEKQEQPSTVSVLDPLFHEDADSPDNNEALENKSTIKCSIKLTEMQIYSYH